MKIELDEHEQATLIGLLVEIIQTSRLPSSPRVKAAKSILAKLGIEDMAVVFRAVSCRESRLEHPG